GGEAAKAGTGEQPPAAEQGNQPKTETGGGQPKTETGGQPAAPEPGKAPKTDSSAEPAAAVSEADCQSLWNGANKNADDVLADDEAKPFVDALKASDGGNTGSGPT